MKRKLGLIFAACAVAGVVAGAAWPPPPIPKNRDDAGEWALPRDALARLPQDAVAQASKSRWVGDASGEDSQAPQQWRLAGILQAPQPVALVVGQGKQKTNLRLEPGAALPDGSRLTGIEGDTITVDRDGCQLVYQLYRPQPVRSTGDCPEGVAAAEQRKSR
ncbi:MAG TPA: hypothetical protein VFF91_04900 [Pseudoxanthomonas sp.]|nr:hypothetical protein [Pseudoxanthomonas sp.]